MATLRKWKIENRKWKGGRGFSIFQFPVSIFRHVAWWVRQVSGDAAYENYLRLAASDSGDTAHARRLMTREEFYLDLLRRRYAGVSRCC